jgi:hypothetical protein
MVSLKPVVRPEVPEATGNPIDAFVLRQACGERIETVSRGGRANALPARLFRSHWLAPDAGRKWRPFSRTRQRKRFERLVDRLLASPRYGERWARHWLDVVHYGDTHGFDKDKPRPNAWPYRDYVIRALNDDKPYARFIEEQIAGDVLHPATRDGIEALGFIAAGPWDFIGHEEIPESKIDGRIARHLDRDDMVANTIGRSTA